MNIARWMGLCLTEQSSIGKDREGTNKMYVTNIKILAFYKN